MSVDNLEEVRKELEELLDQKAYTEVRRLLLEEEAADIAELAEILDLNQLAAVFRMLPKDTASDVFVYLSPDLQKNLIATYTDEQISEVLEGLFNDDLVDILEELPAHVAKHLIKNSPPDRRRQINFLLQYPDESAGSIMTTEYVHLRSGMTVGEAIHKLKTIKQRVEMIYTCFVTDNGRILQGVITVANILRADDNEIIGDIMDDEPLFVRTHDDQEDVARVIRESDLLALPVLDSESRLVGIVTADDVIDVMIQELSEDHQYMGGMQTTELPYPETTVWGNAKRRIFWLMLLMLSGSLNAILLQHYTPIYLAVPALVGIMPRLTSAGGNAASQTSSVEIVALSVGEIDFPDIFKVIWHEFQVSLVCALVLSVLNFAITYFRYGHDIKLATTVGISFLVTIVLSKVLASILPFLATAIKLDPAMVVSPLITTVVDIVALVIYYRIAALLFNL